MDELLDPQHSLHMPAPVLLAAEGSDKALIIRQGTEPHLPRLNLACLINPEVHHLLVQRIQIPTLLISDITSPIEKSIQLKRAKALHPELRVPLKLIKMH